MAGLDGSIKTPVGEVSKKTALIGGVVVVGLAGIVWYRHKQSASTTTDTTATDGEVDPATGYVYGTPEDAAALAAQSGYVAPTDTTSIGGSSSIPTTGTGYTSNGAWTQGVIEYMETNGLVTDGSALSSALGKYITGAYVAVGSADDSLITQAIAVQGYPPVSGSSGYPPAINRNAPTGTTPTTLGTVTGLRASRITTNEIGLVWSTVSGNRGYDIQWTDQKNAHGAGTSLNASFTMNNLPKNYRYTITVRAKPDTGKAAGNWSAPLTVTTKAK